jgi:predicted ABC-type sugar transport system permease subunit
MIALAFLSHFIGDYLLQSDWMAQEKTKRWWPAIAHALTYGLPFLVVTRSIPAIAVIIVTHVIIDHYRLARHVVWVKNLMA